MKKIIPSLLLSVFIFSSIGLVILLFLGAMQPDEPDRYGKFDFHEITSTIRWFSKYEQFSPVTYTSVFNVEREGHWLHVAAMKSTKHHCAKEGYPDVKSTFYLYEDDLKYFLLNTKTGFNSGPLSEYQYVSECEGAGLRFRLQEKPPIFYKLENQTVYSACNRLSKI